MRLYNSAVSGNCYKIRLLLSQLELSYETVDIDILSRVDRRQLEDKNPAGRVPILELDDGRSLGESNAILVYMASGTDYLPQDRFAAARVMQWLFFEQNGLEPYIAVVRFFVSIATEPMADAQTIERLQKRGHAALAVMENHLRDREFLANDRYSIADNALFAYSHVAPEGGIELEPYPAVRAWMERVRSQPRFVPMLDA